MNEISLKTVSHLLNSRYLEAAPSKKAENFQYVHLCIHFILKLLLLLIFISVFVPLAPKMPAPGLDPSWALGLNQAVAQGLSFGKEIIFTLGPYSSIYTKMYHPATDLMMIGGSVYLAFSYWTGIILLMRGVKWHWVLALGICFFAMIYARDSLFFSYPLLAGLVCYKIICTKDLPKSTSKVTPIIIGVLFAPFGLLPLVKGSLLILCISIIVLCSLFFTGHKRNKLAILCLASPLASMFLFWKVAGQSVSHLPDYLFSTLYLAFGFTEAMANNGNSNEIFVYVIASILILLSIYWQKQISFFSRLFLFSIFLLFLFLSFKTGFTRHYGHAFIAGTSILIAALLLPFLFKTKLIIPIIIFCVSSSYFIDSHYTKISITNNMLSTLFSARHGLENRVNNKTWLTRNFDLSLHFIKEQAAFPILRGKTDVYSYNQDYLIASNLTWSPRPIFQSYSVFNPWLARKNKAHLLNKRQPDNVLFKIEPIDQRIPSLEDGMSWPVLLKNYEPTHFVNDFLVLHKKSPLPEVIKAVNLLKKEQHALGEVIKVPGITGHLYTEIDIKPTFYGYLAIAFFKTSPLQITFECTNGLKKQYRIIANMAKSGFLLSPLIENTREFALLYDDKSLLENKQVKSISISGNSWLWNDKFMIYFKTMDKI